MISNTSSIHLLEWFLGMSKGNKEAFNSFYKSYYFRLKTFAFQLLKNDALVEEVVSDLFVKIWLKRETLVEIKNPQMYLYKTLRNMCLNELRKKSLPLDVLDEEMELSSPDPSQILINKELWSLLHAAIETLPTQRKIIFTLIREEGLKQKEVAELLNISVRTVENQLYRAMKYLTGYIETYMKKESNQNNKMNIRRFFLSF
ncbi:RNA polymerase sigma-70 factor [Sphingobacterium sp. SRCM116780]|uniref:RNA polymerase sigma-70 factor n=1 Tax=Sphingobacterium sp. SRCM116780 TaxID=2907623 RepID=UPI001F3E705C|nr:RNA polymerase sigma-70 factor [Sphingobacterium sp. SRCM116780]UIR56903.1 RNA polymerase sigma-70 factor [Sphingobacterium sp. SRCM116780]